MKIIETTYKISAAVTAGVMMCQSKDALAVNFTDVTTNITSSSSSLPNLISTVAYISGIGMGVAGIFKLKAHVDNPGNNPMKDGLVRLGAGGGLLTLPYVTEAMIGTISPEEDGTGPAISTFTGIDFSTPD